MSKKLVKKIIQKQVWAIKKKSVVQVLTPRCRRYGEPEHGRFTTRDKEARMEQINPLNRKASESYKTRR